MSKHGGGSGAEPWRLARHRESAWLVGVLVAALALAWLRIPAGGHGVLWAEDGDTFLREQVELGSFATLFHPYAGYQHFLPRVITALSAELFPLDNFGVAVSLLSLTATALVCAGTFRLSRGIVTWLPARIAVSLVPVLVPLISRELLGDLANLHTYCLWLVVWIFLARSDVSRTEKLLWAGVVLACFLTEVQAIVALPILVVRLLRDRSRWVWSLLVAAFLGALPQLVTWMLVPRPQFNAPHGAISVADILVGWGATALLPVWSGDTELNAEILASHGTGILLLALVPFALAVGIVAALGRWRERGALGALLFVSAAAFAGTLLVNPLTIFQFARLDGDDWLAAQIDIRYGAAAAIFALASFPFAASSIVERWGIRAPRASRVAASALLLAVGIAVVLQWAAVPNDRLAVAPWSAQYREAVATCAAEPAGEQVFAVAPGKSFELACEDLLRSAGE
ncbi:hypothetical protein [Pseudoclavibacter sp. 8L]|uniref:hypothetical protein n=1 Tax=Pseudoclavibacter sp. 8L TaxID=2653162 RepID=UPI0012F0A8D5|nr:hypothetical protein [Pseudoclavibacter sp. 8L]VXB52856.1 conserved membrane hypothetical protein [Pseudoclavibacter sp. 8L]